jgi:hypothetical protein
MYSKRYGCLHTIARRTSGRCHLCHQPVELKLYGRPGTYGDDTVTVDHLKPQAHGGDDSADNLRLAHALCNSYRGTRPFEDVRLELARTSHAPMGSYGRAAVGGAGVGMTAGLVFAKEGESFNSTAAALGFGLTFLLMALAA